MTSRRQNRRLVIAPAVLAAGLVVNSLLGPLGTGVVTYPFPETLVNQTIGPEVVSLLVVFLVCLVTGWLVDRRGTLFAAGIAHGFVG